MGDLSLPSWHVIACDYQAEDAVAREIRDLGPFQALVPKVRLLIPQANRPAIRRVTVAFPGYVMALWSAQAPWHLILRHVRQVDRVLHAVGAPDLPAEIDPGFMAKLLRELGPDGVFRDERSAPEAVSPFAEGARVRVDGRFDGICDWATDRRVSILMGALRMTVPVARAEVLE
jgi:hypothetical protein